MNFEKLLPNGVRNLIYEYITKHHASFVFQDIKKNVMLALTEEKYSILFSSKYPKFCTGCKRYDFTTKISEDIRSCDDCLYNVYYAKAAEMGMWI